MNATGMKELVGAICRDLDLDGCYFDIMPRVTSQQLAQLLDVAEQGHNAETWSWMAAQFLQYGQQELVAAGMGRLIGLLKGNCDAAWVLVKAPRLTDLTDKTRDALVTVVTDSRDASRVLRYATNLSDDHRDRLVAAVTDSHDAAWVLWKVPDLSEENRKHLAKVAG